MEKLKLIVLFGPAGAGKDYILKKALEEIPQLHKPVLYTSRPMREGEVDGINYNFITAEEFSEKVVSGELIEASVFNHWGYGSSLDSYSKDKINILALGIDHLRDFIEFHSNEFEIYPVLVLASDKTRLLRQLNREAEPNVNEIIRRFLSDKKDYEKIDLNHLILPNETNDQVSYCIERLRTLVESI